LRAIEKRGARVTEPINSPRGGHTVLGAYTRKK
jgi:hypothetical protein